MRYFIIFFKWEYDNKQGTGNLSWSDYSFPRSSKVAKFIAAENYIPVNTIVITNLIEVNKEDYESWNE